MDKRELRKIYRAERASANDKSVKDRKIAERLLCSEEMRNADTVLVYVSFDSEIDTHYAVSELLKIGKKVAVPKCGKNGFMEFIYISSENELSEGMYGIPEPSGSEKAVITSHTLCVVPALAFTESGERLGYGGGYYDRFLAEHKNIRTVGLCYECMIADELPSEEYDIKIQKIIMEERTVQCSAEG